MSKEDFETLLNRFSNQLESENLPADKLSVAVEYWCEELGISEDAKTSINDWIDTNINNSQYKDFSAESSARFHEFFQKLISTINKMIVGKVVESLGGDRDDTRSILLISFVVVSIGLLHYYSNRRSSTPTQPSVKTLHYSMPSSASRKWFLLLVVNIKHEELVERLTSNYRIEKSDCEMLHRATQALWMGSEENFPEFNSGSWFPRGKVSPIEFSEYDVYFLKIRLKQQDKGFEQNANQIDRLDAFLGLIQNCIKVEASPRLSSKSYGNEIFYSR